ncbi:MAG: hypothetical protein QW540_10170 [Archaeoglobaceae archaeon]
MPLYIKRIPDGSITLHDIKEAFNDVDMTKKDKAIVKIAERAIDEFQKAKEREEKLSQKISL